MSFGAELGRIAVRATASHGLALVVALLASQPSAAAVAPGKAQILRDAYGVPHIYAETTYGLYYGFGYALAEDKLYQMEILRRTATGRVAEVLGKRHVDSDIAARRRIDIADLEAQFARLPDDDKDIFRGLADGFSARVAEVLTRREALLPKDFTDSAFLPESWQPRDFLAIFAHSMALRFSDINGELDSLALFDHLSKGRTPAQAWRLFDRFRWAEDGSAPTTIDAGDAGDVPSPTSIAAASGGPARPNGLKPFDYAALDADASRAGVADGGHHASNAWVVGPGRMAKGQAVLVNGPQMGDYASSYIWAVGLHGAGFDMVGSGPIGSPWLIFGSNGAIGWGATAGLGDTTDIYQEQLVPGAPQRYRYKGRERSMTERVETIAVKGQPPRRISIYATVHGTVELVDPAMQTAYARRRTWAGAEVSSLVAWIHATKARDYSGWRRAVSKVALTVNNYFIDRQGRIAYQFLGRFPVRPANQDFRFPAMGDGSMEWRGMRPASGNPHVVDPRGSLIVNWNNKPAPGYGNSDFMFWSRVDRVNELTDYLGRLEHASPDDVWGAIRHSSYTDVTARYLIALLDRHHARLGEGAAQDAARLLMRWNRHTADPATARQEPGNILYQLFLDELLRSIFAPFIPDAPAARRRVEHELYDRSPVFPGMGVKIAVRALDEDRNAADLLGGRDSADVLGAALAAAWAKARARHGDDPARWTLPATPHVFERLSYAGVPESTDTDALSLPVQMNRGTENHRIVASGGTLSYCDVTPPGQSGSRNPDGSLPAHARDQLGLYRDFGCKDGWINGAEARRHAVTNRELTFDRRNE